MLCRRNVCDLVGSHRLASVQACAIRIVRGVGMKQQSEQACSREKENA